MQLARESKNPVVLKSEFGPNFFKTRQKWWVSKNDKNFLQVSKIDTNFLQVSKIDTKFLQVSKIDTKFLQVSKNDTHILQVSKVTQIEIETIFCGCPKTK